MMKIFCLALVAATAAGSRRPPAESVSLATIPMHMYASDCGKQRPVSLAQMSKVPGAGLGKVEPFKTVLKDGFFQVSCIKDMMFAHGDKFGDQKFDYTLGEVSNVSIVHYNDVVAKEDRKEMTHETCFEFCRTVPDMLNFALIHGRDCYCAPYFEQMAGDSSDCDEVCSAKPTQMCGGKTKSLIFEMHECSDTKANLVAANSKSADVLDTLGETVTNVNAIATAMQDGAQKLQDQYGKAGDPAAADLFQSAKVFAGEVQHAGEDKQKTHDALTAASDQGTKLSSASDFKDYDTNEKAQSLTKNMEKLVADGEDGVEDLEALSKLASPVDKDLKGEPSKQYYSLMYFVDKKHVDDPSTCSGAVVNKPMTGVTLDECASACDKEVLSCVGFNYYPEDNQFCFLFSKFEEATYYTGCEAPKPSFLQFNIGEVAEKKNADGPTCYAKLSEFENTDISPDASGKCAGCLKKATKAARCYK